MAYLPYLLLLFVYVLQSNQLYPLDENNSIYSIPYMKTFRPDLIQKYIGCKYRVAYSSYTFPQGLRDMAMIYTNPYSFGGGFNCRPKQTYLKVFGYAQDYSLLKQNKHQPQTVADSIQKYLNGKFSGIIVDWKNDRMDIATIKYLQRLVSKLQSFGVAVYIKIPGSYVCRQVEGKPYILNFQNAKKVIVQMYGEDPSAYTNIDQIFQASKGQLQVDDNYPTKQCPKFPSYTQLTKINSKTQFFIEKTLQQEQPGFLGRQFLNILKNVENLYNKPVFYDAYPPNIYRL